MSTRAYTDPDARKRRILLAVFAVLFVVGAVGIYFGTRPKPTVEERIAAAFESAKIAAQKGDISGAVAVVSPRFKAGDVTKKKLRLILFRARQEYGNGDWTIEIAPPRVLPPAEGKPNERLVITRIVARGSAGESIWSTGDSPITLLMREETVKTWNIFPHDEWRIVAAPSIPGL